MSFLRKLLKPSFRNYTLTLCIFYLLLVFFFHSNLEPGGRAGRSRGDVTRRPPDQAPVNQVGPNDVIEEKADRPEVKLNPDSQAARYLREYRAMYANPPGENYQPKKVNFTVPKTDRPCLGTPMRETHEFIRIAPEMYVYSVFWDPRPNDFDNKDEGVYLRVMSIIMTRLAKSEIPLFCIFEDSTNAKIPVRATYYEMCENHGRQFGGYILSCKVPKEIYGSDKNVPPCRIRISANVEYDHEFASDLKIVNTVPLETQRDFSICVAPLYGEIPHSQLIEFMELSSILGADHVTFYDFSIPPEALSLLNYFESAHRVTIIPWKMSPAMDTSIWYHGQLISILDCLYRNMAHTKYLAFNDIDEYMVPYNYTNWYQMMQDLDSDDKCAYQFNSVFIDPGLQQEYDGPKEHRDLITLTNTKRTLVTSHIRTKCMVKPQVIFEAGIHHISKPILAHLQTIRMDLPVAALHHHRVCQPNFGMNCENMIEDKIIPTRYSQVLYKQYSETKGRFEGLLRGER